ncbi:17355_t:CDS:2, partial [Funneliformis geosporum]
GWKTALEPENFNLISILKFRRTKDDFSLNKSVEHTRISKFVSQVANTEERKWSEVASDLNVSKVMSLPVVLSSQARWEIVKSFWDKIEFETSTQLMVKKVDQIEAEQQVQATNNASIQMNVIQKDFINKSYLRGCDHDLQVDGETSKEVRPSYRQDEESTTAKMNEENHHSENDLREATDSMVGKVERTPLMVDNIDLEEIFIDYCDRCENIFDLCNSDIMDMRPSSHFTREIAEESWSKFVLDTYPEHNIPKGWKDFIQEFFKPKDSLQDWKDAWRGLYKNEINENEIDEDLLEAVHNILGPYIEAFEAPYNVLKSGDLEENQFNAQFISPILKNALKVVCSVDWRILEVPVKSSKSRRNANINPFIDKVLTSKRADGIARLWEDHEEVFIYEQTGPPDFDDITEFHIHDYKLVRTMRDVLNQRIILRLKSGMYDHKELSSFGAFGHQTEVSLYWCTIHQRAYCIREYGSFK